MSNKSVDNDVLDFLKNLGQKHNAERVVLFGSRARGDNHETSDYDVAFFGIPDSRSQLDIMDACIFTSPTLKKIDASFDKELSENFLQSIKKEGKIIYERNKT